MTNPTIRRLRADDLQNGFLASLDSLRKASDIDGKKAEEIFEKIDSNPDHVIAVAEIDGRIVGSSTLLIEQKFIHRGGLVGHIEDVVVDSNFQGRGVGEMIMRHLLEIAEERGCYKTILDCTDDVRPFYEKLGFRRNASEMRFDHT